MKNFIFPIFLLTLTSMNYAFAQKSSFKLVGSAMLEFSIFKIDIYKINYLKNSTGDEKLELVYQRDIKKEHSIQGWEIGMKPLLKEKPQLKKNFKWFVQHTSAMKKNDKFEILRHKNMNVSLVKNGKLIASITGLEYYEMSFYPWLGNNPVDKDLKKSLLNIK